MAKSSEIYSVFERMHRIDGNLGYPDKDLSDNEKQLLNYLNLYKDLVKFSNALPEANQESLTDLEYKIEWYKSLVEQEKKGGA